MKKYAKEKKIEAVIRTLWTSLESHIPYIYLPHEDGKKFHKKTSLEYLEAIKKLIENL